MSFEWLLPIYAMYSLIQSSIMYQRSTLDFNVKPCKINEEYMWQVLSTCI